MDMSASRTDVASSIEVSDLFTIEPLSFDVMAATDYIDNCTTRAESEDLCGILDEILYTLEDVDAEVANTPERLRLVNLVQWAALKCSRRSIRLQNAEFKNETPARIASERRSVEEAGEVGAKAPTHIHLPSPYRRRVFYGGRGIVSRRELSVEVNSAKTAKSVIAPSSPAAKAAESASAPELSQKDDGFTSVGRNGKRIAPIVIDAQSNAAELLTQIGNLCNNTSLQGRFENGKLRVFPTSAEEHRIIQKFVSDKKMRSHTFEMAHNKQLKVVLRGLPTDYNQEELIVSVEPLNKSTLPPQCYRCQEFFHHSRFCTRAPKCLKCSGGHLTSECTKSAKAPAKCANSSGPHPANFSGCPKNPINTKTTKTKAAKNVWQERAAARKQNSKQSKPSFAEIVKGSNNNSLDAKEVDKNGPDDVSVGRYAVLITV
ncbi:nucleic-acid-binding protein from transposon X-element [Trichonephila clavipes]|nr:nucleic-acid-binding protein from transposon X-element [Trichonephila clavipes]